MGLKIENFCFVGFVLKMPSRGPKSLFEHKKYDFLKLFSFGAASVMCQKQSVWGVCLASWKLGGCANCYHTWWWGWKLKIFALWDFVLKMLSRGVFTTYTTKRKFSIFNPTTRYDGNLRSLQAFRRREWTPKYFVFDPWYRLRKMKTFSKNQIFDTRKVPF